MKKLLLFLSLISFGIAGNSAYMLIPMDESQTNHLRAYGIAWHVLDHESDVQWLINYRGGSWLFKYDKDDELACMEKGVSYEAMPDVQARKLLADLKKGSSNTAVVPMERAPKIAVYAPSREEKWDDAVINTLTYAGIPFDVVFDTEVLNGDLSKYDWLHLHHEDFTGQENRFYAGFYNQQWYKDDVAADQAIAKANGYSKVSDMKLAVVMRMKTFVGNGGFLFAMCSATETFDVALSAEKTDIAAYAFDGDGTDPDYASKLNFENCMAFQGFKLDMNPMSFNHSNIDTYMTRNMHGVTESNDYFSLNSFDVKTQLTQAMLVQNHASTIKGFWGATTGFDKAYLKNNVDVLASCDVAAANEARYIHGNLGKGMWTFFGGHDPEDYQHRVGDAAPDMTQFSNSPGYRLILNNVLFQSTRTIEETHQVFSAYPSPAVSELTVNYALEEGATGTLNIYDMSGKLMQSENLEAGSNAVRLDVSSFSNGTYLWNISSNGKSLHSDNFAVSR